MPRRPAFSFATLHVQFSHPMARTFAVNDELPADMKALLARLERPSELSISERLRRLKQLFEEQTCEAA